MKKIIYTIIIGFITVSCCSSEKYNIYSVKDKNIQILEITQKSIQSAINSLYLNEDWGDPKQYDIKINRSWKDLKTEYVVTPSPSKILNPDIVKEFESRTINLEALFEWKDPFLDSGKKNKFDSWINIEDVPFLFDIFVSSAICLFI